jgi:hypothetical protein
MSDIRGWRDVTLGSSIVVRKASDFGAIDSTKVYLIDGIVDMSGVTVEVPAGGINMLGTTFDVSQLVSTDNSYDMFVSAVGGCGNILAKDIGFEASGTSSQVWNLTSLTGFEAFEFDAINYNNCTKAGTLTNFRQGTTSIVRGLSAGMTEPLFKAGAGFAMSSRFLTDINCDLPASAAFCDFAPANFPSSSTFQIMGGIFSRGGVFDADDGNIFPNFPATSLSASFVGNKGVSNTFVGGLNTLTTEVLTPIGTQDQFETLLGTFTASDLAHFDSPANGQLRHLGDTPREYQIFADLTIDGGANDEIKVRFRKWDDSASVFIALGEHIRQVNNFTGGRDVAFYTILEAVTLDTNDYVYIEVANATGLTDVTLDLASYFRVDER